MSTPAVSHPESYPAPPASPAKRGGRGGILKPGLRVMTALFVVACAAIGLRILMSLLGASREPLFSVLVYALTDLIAYPFEAIFLDMSFGNHSILERDMLVAGAFYAMLLWGVVRMRGR